MWAVAYLKRNKLQARLCLTAPREAAACRPPPEIQQGRRRHHCGVLQMIEHVTRNSQDVFHPNKQEPKSNRIDLLCFIFRNETVECRKYEGQNDYYLELDKQVDVIFCKYDKYPCTTCSSYQSFIDLTSGFERRKACTVSNSDTNRMHFCWSSIGDWRGNKKKNVSHIR